MLKTVRAFLALMQNQKKEIVFSVVLSFIDGFFIMIPFIIAFKIVNAIPLFNPVASGTLDVRTMVSVHRYYGGSSFYQNCTALLYALFPRRGRL